jgi:hypothetical protein
MTDSEPNPDRSRTGRRHTSRRKSNHVRNAVAPRRNDPALDDPELESAPLAFSHQPVTEAPSSGLKALLEAAPLDGINLARPRDFGRPALSRTGFMAGQFTVPDDFDRMIEGDIADLFETKE